MLKQVVLILTPSSEAETAGVERSDINADCRAIVQLGTQATHATAHKLPDTCERPTQKWAILVLAQAGVVRSQHTKMGKSGLATPAMVVVSLGMFYVAVSNHLSKEYGRGEQ
jgi:hypothetical protein